MLTWLFLGACNTGRGYYIPRIWRIVGLRALATMRAMRNGSFLDIGTFSRWLACFWRKKLDRVGRFWSWEREADRS